MKYLIEPIIVSIEIRSGLDDTHPKPPNVPTCDELCGGECCIPLLSGSSSSI